MGMRMGGGEKNSEKGEVGGHLYNKSCREVHLSGAKENVISK